MLRSLFTGISGLRTHQIMMDVTGNNIANANTNGFKTSATVFQDTLSQMLQGPGAPDQGLPPAFGGTSPAQVGLGVRLGGISTNYGQGATQITGRPTDIMLNGDGFFVVKKGNEDFYTRAGALSLDLDGHLVTPDGAMLCFGTGATGTPLKLWNPGAQGVVAGSGTAPTGANDVKAMSIGPDGKVNMVKADGTKVSFGPICVATFANAGALVKVGNTAFRADPATTGAAVLDTPGVGARGTLTAGALEMSNVDLAQEFTNMIISQRGFQANSRIITASDEILQDLVNLKR